MSGNVTLSSSRSNSYEATPLKNPIGVGEMALGRDIVDEAEFVAGLDQAAEGVLRALKATGLWHKTFAAEKS